MRPFSLPQILNVVALIGVLSFGLGCQQAGMESQPGAKPVTAMSGGHDGGGGQTLQSTEAEVHAAIDRALELAAEPDYRFNLFTQWQWARLWWVHAKSTDESLEIFNLGCRVVAGPDGEKACREFTGKPKDEKYGTGVRVLRPFMAQEYFPKTLKQSPLRRADGDCRVEDGKHAHASVSAFKVGAEICFSIPRLRELPPSALLREVMGLLFHEVAHLNGVDEEYAQRLQSAFTEFFIKRFGQPDREVFVRESNEKLYGAHISSGGTATDALKPFDVSRVLQAMGSLPFYWDPVAVQIHMNIKDIKGALSYVYSVMNLMIKYDHYLQSESGKERPSSVLKKSDLQADVSQLIGTYNALAAGEGVKIHIREHGREGVLSERMHVWPDPRCPKAPVLHGLGGEAMESRLHFRAYWSQVFGWILSNEYHQLPSCQ